MAYKIGQLESSTQTPKTMKSHSTSQVFWQPPSSLTLYCTNLNGFITQPSAKPEMKCYFFISFWLCLSLPHVSLLQNRCVCPLPPQLYASLPSVCVGMLATAGMPTGPPDKRFKFESLFPNNTSFKWQGLFVCWLV